MPRKRQRRPTAAPLVAAGQGDGIEPQAVGVAPRRRREERLEEDEHKFHIRPRKRDFLVSLSNDRRMDIRDVQHFMLEFRWLRRKHPLHFQALFDIAQGNLEKVSEDQINDLKEWRILSPRDGSFLPNERDVLLAAGPELNDPYKADTITDQLHLAMADEEADANFWRKALKPKRGKQDRSPE
jgi:hypothetical protein